MKIYIYTTANEQSKVYIRECGSTLYVEMAQGVSFSLYIGIGAKFENTQKPAKEGYVQLNIERSYYKLTLKESEHIPLRNNRASKIPVFVFFFFFFARTKLLENSRTVFFDRTGSQSDNIQNQGFRGS